MKHSIGGDPIGEFGGGVAPCGGLLVARCKGADTIESLRARVAELESSPTMAAVCKMVESKVAEENTRLYQRIAELEAERDKLITAVADHVTVRADQYQTIAAQALTIKAMREALEKFIDSHEECTGFDGFTAQIVSMDDYHEAQEALALPDNSTEVLQAWLDNQFGEPIAVVDANDEGYWATILPDRGVKVDQQLYAKPKIK